MKILWHSVAPWAKTGYGTQTAVWVPRLASLGHTVAISAFSGLWGGPVNWREHFVYPSGNHKYGGDVIAMNAAHFGADLVITLMDFWALEDAPLKGLPLAGWLPLDTNRLNHQDAHGPLRSSGAVPVAMTHHGEKILLQANYRPLYAPHGIDTNVFKPPEDRKALRQAMGIDDRFVIGINAANLGMTSRKSWPQQMEAFARLYRKHKDVLLHVHSVAKNPASQDLEYMAEDYGIKKAVKFSMQFLLSQGLITASDVAGTMGAWDLLTACSMGEGFGLPIVEAQACGTPVVATNASAMKETCGGWLVSGHEEYVGGHRAFWVSPDIGEIAEVYEEAYQRGPGYQLKRAAARGHAMQYDADRVLKEHWAPVLDEIMERLRG